MLQGDQLLFTGVTVHAEFRFKSRLYFSNQHMSIQRAEKNTVFYFVLEFFSTYWQLQKYIHTSSFVKVP